MVMTTQQVRFRLEGDTTYFGGILVKDGKKSFVICGCCGGIAEMDEIEEIKKYENWVDLSEKIIGE